MDGINKAFPGRKTGYVGKSCEYNQDKLKEDNDQYPYVSSEEEKERHSSGESVDSCFSECTPSESDLESLNDDKPDECDKGAAESIDQTLARMPEGNSTGVKDKAPINNIRDSNNEYDSKEAQEQQNDNLNYNKDNCQPRGILKRCVRRCFSESHATSQTSSDNLAWSNAIFDAINSNAESSSSSTSSEDSNRMIEDVTAHKKSVRFNEIVQRQIFRSNSSILKQKRKNEKRLEHKLKKRGERCNVAVERRASEGDAESLLDAGFKLSSSFEKSIFDQESNNGYSSSENGSVSPSKNNAFQNFNAVSKKEKLAKTSIQFVDNDSHTDSGVASSYDDHVNNSPITKNMEKIPEEGTDDISSSNNEASKASKKSKKKKNKLARGKSQQQGQFIKESNTDLIFDLDF